MSGTDRQPHEYDVDNRFAHIRVDVLGQRYTDVVRVCEKIPDLPDGVEVYLEHIDAVDLQQGQDPQITERTLVQLQSIESMVLDDAVSDRVVADYIEDVREELERSLHTDTDRTEVQDS